MKKRRLGRHGPEVFPLGLGCMGMSDFYGPADRGECIATIHAALDAGVNLYDTGDFYGMGLNEMLIGEALKGVPRERYLLSVKFGAQRGPDGAWMGYDARPKAVRTALAYSLKRLGVEHIDVYRPARLDPAVPIEDTIGAIAELIRQGYVRYVGLSEVGAETIRRAHATHPVCDLQIEYSLMSRGVERSILPTLRDLGIGITAYGVLSRGLISESTLNAPRPGGFRGHLPRFSEANIAANLRLVSALRDIAAAKGVSAAQLAIAWVASRGEDILPLIGARKRTQLAEALGALEVSLTQPELAAIEAAMPAAAVQGARYAPEHMAMLDSER